MNNKFLELAKQAGAAADHGVTGVDDENFLIMSGDEIEKFAELIVKECIWQLECAKQGDSFTGETYDNEVNDVLTEQIDNLKEHFGV